MRYLGVDPGGTTGLFKLDLFANDYNFEHLQVQGLKELHQELHRILPDVIVCENFDRRQKPGHIVPIIEGIAIVKLYHEYLDIPVELQTASYGKGFWDNGKLKRVGMYVTGEKGKHSSDAARHVLQYISERVKDRRFIMMLKPEDFAA